MKRLVALALAANASGPTPDGCGAGRATHHAETRRYLPGAVGLPRPSNNLLVAGAYSGSVSVTLAPFAPP
jgi:hypothetical protein